MISIFGRSSTTALALCFSVCAAQAQPQPAPFDITRDGQLGAWLERNFSDMLFFCLNGQKLKLRRNNDHDVSSIPLVITRAFRLDTPETAVNFRRFADASMTRLFGYVYPQNASRFGGNAAAQSRYLPGAYDNTNDQIAEDGLGLITYESDCASTLSTAVSLNAGYSIAPVTLQAAGRAAYERRFDQFVSLTHGTFVSPLWRDWQASTPNRTQADRFRAAMLFWAWYRQNGVSTGNKLLSEINGFSLYRTSGQASRTSIDAQASAGFSLPILTARTEVNTDLQSGERARRRQYEFVMLDRGNQNPQASFVDFPPIADVVAAIRSTASPHFLPIGDNIIRPGVPVNFNVDVPGLPPQHCNRNYSVKPTDPARVDLLEAALLPRETGGHCRMLFRYTPPGNLPNGPNEISFDVTLSDATLRAGVTPFTLPMRGAFTTTDRPRLEQESSFPVRYEATQLIATEPRSLVRWVATVRIVDGGAIQELGQIDVRGLRPQGCASPSASDFRVERVLLPRESNESVRMRIEVSAEYGAAVAGNWQTVECALTGTIVYTIGGRPVERPFTPRVNLIVPMAPPARTTEAALPG